MPEPLPQAPQPDVWTQRVAAHGHRVLVALLANGLSLADAQDAAQEAWARIIAKANAGQLPVLELPGLVVQQAMFLHLSRARRERLLVPDADDGAVQASAEDQVAAARQLAHARTLLDQEKPSVQRIFSLAYGEPARSHQEIGREVGLSTQRVRQVLCEVRARLRAQWKEK
jgi:RNA polymerase sigma-70 factor (ECF subfamily)